MKRDKEKTTVQFFLEPPIDGQKKPTPLAIFPEEKEKAGYTCYAHIGQHSTAAPEYIKELRPATPYQYADLKAELESLGYNLHIQNL